MDFRRRGVAVSTNAIVGIVVAIVVIGALGYYFASTNTGGAVSTSSNTTGTSTGISSSSSTSQSAASSSSSASGSTNILIVLNPTGVYVSPGTNESYTTIKIVPLSTGGASSMKLKPFNLPQGVTGSISPATVDLTQGTQIVGLSLSVSQSVKPGTYQLALSGVAGSTNKTETFQFTVVQYLVYMQGVQYQPSSLTVPVGTTVTWMNLEGMISQYDLGTHDVSFTSGSAAQSPALNQFAIFTYTFTQAGTYSYYCTYHPTMKAQILVTG